MTVTGSDNSAFGFGAGVSVTGSDNLAFGTSAGNAVNASRTIALGLSANASSSDAIAIGAVHVAAWRSTYPGILPDRFLARLSVPRQAAHYDAAIHFEDQEMGKLVHQALTESIDSRQAMHAV